MAYPSRTITGQLFTGGGDVVIAGKIEAWLIPAGAVVLDTTDASVRYKVAAYEVGFVNTVGVYSLALTALDSVNPRDAYYRIRFEITAPFYDTWSEFWRITGAGSGALPIQEILPMKYGPNPGHVTPGVYGSPY